MPPTIIYTIKQWKKTFENNRSREILRPCWVAMPNKHDTLGFKTLIALPDGPAMYGAWCILVQIASRCTPKGSLVRDGGQPLTPEAIAIKSGMSPDLIKRTLETLQQPDIDWIAASPQEGAASPQEGAASPQEGAASPQEGAARARARGRSEVRLARAEQTDKQEGIVVSSSRGEFEKTSAAICSRFPIADAALIGCIIQDSFQAYAGVDNPKIPEPDDALIAEAVIVAVAGAPKQTSPALFRKTVPVIIANWAKCGRNGRHGKPPGHIDSTDIERHQAERRKLIEAEKNS